jgi:acetate kinase
MPRGYAAVVDSLVLTVNTGSSSVRLALFATNPLARLDTRRIEGHDAAALGDFLGPRSQRVGTVSHRVVHGGPQTQPCLVDGPVERAIAEAADVAPLHNPIALEWIRACRSALPDARQVAVFDTGFFAALPAHAARYAIPARLSERWGVRRFGFHGLAHRSMLAALGSGPRRVITLQLGSGCSAAALLDGRPIDTSMGFTPLEGLVMGTRAGDVDPGLVLHVMKREQLTPDAMSAVLSDESGLAGLAGTTNMGELLTRTDEDARLAVQIFCYRIRKYVGAYLAALGGCDALAFGGGIGEHFPAIRAEVLAGLDELGFSLDAAANAAARPPARISTAASRAIHVLPTDEESLLAADALQFL